MQEQNEQSEAIEEQSVALNEEGASEYSDALTEQADAVKAADADPEQSSGDMEPPLEPEADPAIEEQEQASPDAADESDTNAPYEAAPAPLSEEVFPETAKVKRKWSWKKKTLVIALSLLIVVCTVGAGVFLYFKQILDDPFGHLKPNTSTPLPTGSSYDEIERLANKDFLNAQGIVNILLVGVDYAEERETWNGKHAYHADVMMVLAVNKTTQRVDMISLPRDTYAKIPSIKGIYKLNSSIDCGGGFPEGLPKVVEAAEWMLGGIPIDYYYAVTMPIVKELVDAIGGVMYDMDVDFAINGRSYAKGMQQMSGQAVLDYIRVRKEMDDDSQEGDLNRINRQKKILIAIFKQMQANNLWTSLPTILGKVGGIETNADIGTTAALACIAYKLKEENITMRSMGGTMRTLFWDWRYCFTDQANRVKVIQDVYGMTKPEYSDYTLESARRKWANMMYSPYVQHATAVINAVQKLSPSPSVTPTPGTTPKPPSSPSATPITTPTLLPSATPTSVPTASPTHSTVVTPTPTAGSGGLQHISAQAKASDLYQKYIEVQMQLAYVKYLFGDGPRPTQYTSSGSSTGEQRINALVDLKTKCIALATMIGNQYRSESSWEIPCYPKYNEVNVDFR